MQLIHQERNFQNWAKDAKDRALDKPLNISLSGHEQNHLFLNSQGTRFDDVSGISGLDSEADGRVFVTLDYDRDGLADIAVVNSSYPRFHLYRNRLGEHVPKQQKRKNFVAVKFVGGNRSSKPSLKYSNRDGYGAAVRIKAGELSLLREHRCGDGFASQNSAILLIGIGDHSSADTLNIQWPNKKTEQTLKNVKSGTLVTVYENPADSPNKTSFVQEPYVVSKAAKKHTRIATVQNPIDKLDFLPGLSNLPKENPPQLLIYITSFTTCEACHRSHPQLESLKKSFQKGQIALLGVPVDLFETTEILSAYEKENSPPYRYLRGYDETHHNRVMEMIVNKIGDHGTPSTFITDLQGNVLFASVGVPSISDVRKILHNQTRKQLSASK